MSGSGQKAEKIAVSNVGRQALAQPSMRRAQLVVEPHAAAVNSVPPLPLLLFDFTFEVFFGVMESITEAFHIQ